MDQLQRNILEALFKRRMDLNKANLNTVWQDTGSVDPGEFKHARRVLVDANFVTLPNNARRGYPSIRRFGERVACSARRASNSSLCLLVSPPLLPVSPWNRVKR